MSLIPNEVLGTLVRAEYSDGSERDMAEVVAFAGHPTYTFEEPDGTRWSWAAHLCKEPTSGQLAEYWRSRALEAEAEIVAMKEGES